jgi:hypothetical protein
MLSRRVYGSRKEPHWFLVQKYRTRKAQTPNNKYQILWIEKYGHGDQEASHDLRDICSSRLHAQWLWIWLHTLNVEQADRDSYQCIL